MLLNRAIPRRSATELAAMRRAGLVVAEMHETIRAAIRPGVTTLELDRIGRDVIDRRGATSNFLGYHGFPAVICASPNNVIVHGIPDGRVLDEGDIVAIDCGAVVDGWHGDAAFTAPVGTVSAEAARLIDVADRALAAGIAHMVNGDRLGDLGHAIETLIEAEAFSVVREYTGHGIGQAMHEEPPVPNHGRPGNGIRLRPGNVLAIEPMVNAGGAGTAVLEDGWGVVTLDGRWSAHVEHTVVVTDNGPEILTR
jgi:methionyl aminopeptidase